MNSLIQESKLLKKKLASEKNKNDRNQGVFAEQQNLLEKMRERYDELCETVGEVPQLKINENEKGGYEFELTREKMPKIPKNKIKYVSQYWKDDVPSKFQIIENPKQFQRLLKKVRALKKSVGILEKDKEKLEVTHVEKLAKLDEEEEKLSNFFYNLELKIKEKEKEYHFLSKTLKVNKRGLRSGALIPLERIMRVKELENQHGTIIGTVGHTETEIEGDHAIIRNHPRYKMRYLLLW